jgi:hypothetical protein
MEARPITAGTVTRRCIVVKIGELAYDRFKEILEQGAGSILVLLPRNISRYSLEEIQVENPLVKINYSRHLLYFKMASIKPLSSIVNYKS